MALIFRVFSQHQPTDEAKETHKRLSKERQEFISYLKSAKLLNPLLFIVYQCGVMVYNYFYSDHKTHISKAWSLQFESE